VLPPPISELVPFAVLDALLDLALLNSFASLFLKGAIFKVYLYPTCT
jgi:hypothetical protein